MAPTNLQEIYNNHIDIPLYRVTPKIDYEKIKNKGLDPKQDPYNSIKPQIDILDEAVNRLEGNGNKFYLRRRTKEVSGAYALDRMQDDMSKMCVDFSPDIKEMEYYSKMNGGANTYGLKEIIKNLDEFKHLLSSNEKSTIADLENWLETRNCGNLLIKIKGSSPYLESALFQLRSQKTVPKPRKITKKAPRIYMQNPFGRYVHFCKVINKSNLDVYLKYLDNKRYYIRVKELIPFEEIELV